MNYLVTSKDERRTAYTSEEELQCLSVSNFFCCQFFFFARL